MFKAMETETNQNVTEINVGGQLVSTLSSTLEKEGNILKHMSCDKSGRHFIDCDFDVFKHVLDFLRSENNLPTPEMALKVYDLAKNIECETLVKKLESYHAVKYRKQMEDISKSVGEGHTYKSLKQTAIERIEKLYVGPGEDKALHIPQTHFSTCCRPFKDGEEGFPFRDIIIYANVVFDILPNVGDEMLALLAFDLCTLGFGKYAITNKYEKHCKSCYNWFRCKQIILLAH